MYRANRANQTRVPPAAAGQGPDISAKPKAPHRNRLFCRTSEYKPPGSERVGLGPSNQPSKVVWETDYGLSEAQFKHLSGRFPGVAFVQTGTGCHDHPIAHTSYRVVWHNVTSKLRPGSKVADVSGNPAYNEGFNAGQVRRKDPIHIDTFCKVMSTKDSIRQKTRWGPQVKDGKTRWEEMTLYDMYRFEENRRRFAGYDVFLMNHTLYYHELGEINQLLQLNPGSCLYATIHKLPGQRGTINCGEQEYEKDFTTGKVVQTNVETGETYKHGDPAPWFSKFAYADANGAFAWTVNKGCDDTYIITATSTDPRLVEEDCWLDGKIHCFSDKGEREVLSVAVPDVAGPPPAYREEEVELSTTQIFPGCETVKTKKVRITHPELYTTLRNYMINKPRNNRTLQDLTAKAHREVGNNAIYQGVKAKVKIDPVALAQHIAAAWVGGAGVEDEMFTFASGHASSVSAMNRNLSGKSLAVNTQTVGKQVLRFALLAQGIRKSSDPITRVLENLDDLL